MKKIIYIGIILSFILSTGCVEQTTFDSCFKYCSENIAKDNDCSYKLKPLYKECNPSLIKYIDNKCFEDCNKNE